MPVETLHFENARLAQQLFNHEPRNLQALENQLGVRSTSREGWIKLEGAADGLERAKNLFISLENSLKAGSPVRNREFMQALDIVKHEGVSRPKT
jgi:phosphate starvation-inducible PhoH-like protein